MMNYNEWKTLQENTFSLGLKTPPTVGGPIGGMGFYEGGFNFGKDKGEEDDYDDEDGDGEDDDEDDDLSDDQLDGDIFGADKSEGGPDKSFPPDDSEDMDAPDDMDSVLGGIDPDLAGLGDDKSSFGGAVSPIGGDDMAPKGGEGGGNDFDLDAMMGGDDMGGGDMGGLGGDDMGGLGGDEMGGLGGDEMGGLGGDDMGGLGGDDMGGLGGDDMGGLGGDDMGGLGGDDMDLGGDMGGDGLDDMGDMGEPCPDCNPDGDGEGDPECHSCHGHGFMDDQDGGELDGGEMGHDIDKMNFMNHMMNYQKKYMGANPSMPQQQPQMGQQPQQMGQQQMNPQQMQQMMQAMQQPKPNGAGQQFQKKFMAAKPQQNPILQTRKPDNGGDMRKRSYCGTCENTVGTYKETQDDFFANLAKNAKGESRKKFSSGIREDALLQAVDPNYEAQTPESGAGNVGFAPQGRIGAIGGGYTQADIQDLPVLGESKKSRSKKR